MPSERIPAAYGQTTKEDGADLGPTSPLTRATPGADAGLARWVHDEREKRGLEGWDVGLQIIRYSTPPGLWNDTTRIAREVCLEYSLHSDDPMATGLAYSRSPPGSSFGRLDNEQQKVIAEGNTIPCD